MAASAIETFVVLYKDSQKDQLEKWRAETSVSYSNTIQDDLRVLSKNTNGNPKINGFLYLPDYPEGSPCSDQASQSIPQNVTRMRDIPKVDEVFIALAPWTSPRCVQELLAAASNIEAFIFYLPDSQPGIPPPMNDPVWSLGDGGSWKSSNNFPVYAIPGPTGLSIMAQLGQYSGAISDAPNGSQLMQKDTDAEGARMYAAVDLGNNTALPSLWAFLLIVLGIVLFMIGITSGVMHLYQRRRRTILRRRIVNGEVDLERLGIKRLTVPQDAINMLPTFVYNPSEKELLDVSRGHITALSDFPIKESDSTAPASPPAELAPTTEPDPAQHSTLPSPPLPTRSSAEPNQQQPSYAQPTCPICLDDFTPQETTVRSLPCHHIYHPECIDPFLLRNSSLCPICKAKVLPQGYCPETITNAMVRRERQQRRNRDRVRRIRGEDAAAQMPVASHTEPTPSRFAAIHDRVARFGRGSRSASTAGVAQQSSTVPPAVEMTNMNHDGGPSVSGPPETTSTSPPPSTPNEGAAPSQTLPPPTTAVSQPSQTQTPSLPASTPPIPANTRSERARRRASLFMREHQPTVEEQEQERWARLPRWRKAIKSVFPGF
ncbi:MAG: hypothetical protein Q9169_001101 [Polycauliona sp. 2 TL-2023]